ncbi:hypothetical protein DsansV1_C21g0167531 [Dioscorea sansibarensis]
MRVEVIYFLNLIIICRFGRTMTYCPDLRKDIMGDITKYLPLKDYIRFGAIRSSWSAKAIGRYHAPDHGFPLLIVNDDSPEGNPRLFNIFTQKFYPLDLPRGYRCCGSSRGWLVMMNSSMKMFLLNPFSKTQIELPSFLLSEEEYGSFKQISENSGQLIHEILLDRLILKAVLSADPDECLDYVIMVISMNISDLKYWRSGDPSWTRAEILDHKFYDVIWYKGAFCALSMVNEVIGVSLNPDLKFKQIAPPARRTFGNCSYLVDCMGDLLIIKRTTEETYTEHLYTRAFSVFKLDEKLMEFIQVKSIGDRALFLGRNSTMAIPASEFPGCLSDSIYFMDDLAVTGHEYGYEDFGLYNMKDKIFEIFPPKNVYTPSKFQPLWLEACPW